MQYDVVCSNVLQCEQKNLEKPAPMFFDAKDDEEQYSQVVCIL